MQVMMLAAGRSTRLGTLGAQLPKPLVPVCGYPAIAFGLAACRAAGFRHVVINVHHHAKLLQDALGDGRRFAVEIRYSVEDELLGTGGGLVKARRAFRSEPVLVWNGKVVADLDLRDVAAAHAAAPPDTIATMVLREDANPGEWAPVAIDATGRVIALRGQRSDLTPVGPVLDRMFTGVHVATAALLDRLPEAGVSDVIGDAYIPALLDGKRIWTSKMEGYFAEHSTPERYLAGNLALLRAPALLRSPPGPLTGVDPGARVEAGARLIDPVRLADGAVVEAGATVGPDVVVCGGGRVAAGARVTRAVVWSGGVATGEIEDAVVTAEGVVAVGGAGGAG
jgi:mannose-1-phosphate guanylyltransferase